MLDDFKTALDKLKQYKLEAMGGFLTTDDRAEFVDLDQARNKKDDTKLNGPTTDDAHRFAPRDWTKAQDSEHLDLESALRMDSTQLGESSK